MFAVGEHIKVTVEAFSGLDVGRGDVAIAGVVDQAHAHPVEVLDDQQVVGGGEAIDEAIVLEGVALLVQGKVGGGGHGLSFVDVNRFRLPGDLHSVLENLT